MTDRELLDELQYVLIEPPDGGDTWPSLIWTRDEVLDAVNAALRALVRGTHLSVKRREYVGVYNPISLPTDWLATAALVWWDSFSGFTPLGPVDDFETDLALPLGDYNTVGTPIGYVDLAAETRTLRLVPAPSGGSVFLLYIAVPPLTTGTAPGTELPVPEELASGVKYGALATLLRKVGRLLDDERARYCERRAELTEVATTILLGGWA